jgi:DNA-binding response OmpR family regulator
MTDTEKKPKKILVVDDDQFLLEMYSIKFKEAGIEVEGFLDSIQALEKLRDGFVADALILDVVMPEVDGLKILETVKAEKLGGNPVVIMLSNQGQESDIEKAQKLGADGYIIKANSVPSEVLAKVLEVYKKKHS